MARRVNTKFIAILFICLMAVAVALGGAWYVTMKSAAATAAREADAALANKDYEKATQLYAKAIRDDIYANDVDLLLNGYEAHSLRLVSQVRDARLRATSMLQWLDRAINVNPHDGRAMQFKMDLLTTLGNALGQIPAWDAMYFECDQLLESYPNLNLAVKYRGISQVNRMNRESTNLTEQERQQIYEDLASALDATPDDADVVKYLCKWHMIESDVQNRIEHDTELAAHHREEALRISFESLNNHDDDLRRLIDYIDVLYSLAFKSADIRPHVDRMYEQLMAQPASPRTTERAVEFLLWLSHNPDEIGVGKFDPEDLHRAQELVELALKRNPDHPQILFLLGQVHNERNQLDQAKQFYKRAWESSSNVGAVEFMIRYASMARGGLGYLGLKMTEIEALKDSQERDEKLAEIEQQLADIKAEIGEIPAVSGLEGRVSQARG
ncbi:MAG: tetratricopeptide repeat protein, partial [Pirellulaceae bacterium]|nr:tetratricopeptide repeat protein [Pirellulaceae bacterium]